MVWEENRPVLLVVDDDPLNRAILHNIFQNFYQIEEAENGRQGLEAVAKYQDRLCALLLDVVMPELDGIQVLRQLADQGFPERTPVFLITAEATADNVREAYNLGVMDVIQKPVEPYVVLRRVQSVIELYQARKRLSGQVESQAAQLLEAAQQIIQLNQGMIEALAAAIEFRSQESGEHVRRIRHITQYLLAHTPMGEGLPPQEVEQIGLAAILHDVGKIAVPDGILNKPGRLTPEEFEVMKGHTTQGAKLLDSIPQFRELAFYSYARDIALHHHERWDGRGYPEGLQGEEISPWAQVVSLADVYDALRCKRVYKEPLPREQVLKMIREGACGVFNPKLLESFFSAEEELSKLYDGREEG